MNRTYFIDREILARAFNDPHAVAAFEEMQNTVADTATATTANVEATEKINEAVFLTLSPNAELPNERVVSLGEGLRFVLTDGGVTIEADAPIIAGGYRVTLVAGGECELVLPLTGILATRDNIETLHNKTVDAPMLTGLDDYIDDAAAAAGGVEVGGVYRNGSVLMVRVA